MINVTVWSDKLLITGHANQAEHGRDIVCASVSVLGQAVARFIESKEYGNVVVSSGYLYADINEHNRDNAQDLLDMFVLSMQDIANQYPHYITMEVIAHE